MGEKSAITVPHHPRQGGAVGVAVSALRHLLRPWGNEVLRLVGGRQHRQHLSEEASAGG